MGFCQIELEYTNISKLYFSHKIYEKTGEEHLPR